ncbi:MAG: heparinase II/III family protein [Planctomycetota bacterium]|jgi:uncharacterized heparinase superfamily protein
MLHSVGQLYRSTRSVPKRQLYRRLQLNIRRWWMPKVGRHLVGSSRPAAVRLASVLPASLFAPREHLVRRTLDGPCLSHLGTELPLTPPVDWLCRSRPGTRHLDRLALHYHEFLESVTFEEGWALVEDWIHQNPPWQPGYWLDSWNSYAISIRCVCWFQWWEKHRSRLSPEQQEQLRDSLIDQLIFLESNLETDICGNHLIKNIRCLLWGAAFFDGSESKRWKSLARGLLDKELRRQWLSDGMHYELSPAYHCQVLADLLECAAVMDDHERAVLLAAVEPMLQAMRVVTHPDGKISLFSDGGLSMAYSPREIEEVAAKIARGSHPASTPSTRSFRELPAAGYFQWQSDRQWLLIDCGPVCEDSLPAHGHADMLALEWDVDGQRILVDNGVYEYQSGENRRFDRSVASHNTLQVDSLDQAEFIGSFRTGWRYRAKCESVWNREGTFELVGSHDAFASALRNLRYQRRFFASPDRLVIEDVLRSHDRKATFGAEDIGVTATARFLFHDGCHLERSTDSSIRIRRGSTRIEMRSSVPLRVVSAHWSPDFGIRVATRRVEATWTVAPGSVSFEFVLEP